MIKQKWKKSNQEVDNKGEKQTVWVVVGLFLLENLVQKIYDKGLDWVIHTFTAIIWNL